MLTRRIAYERGLECPWWMGMVVQDHRTRESVVAPIPLNLLMRACYLFWLFLRAPFYDSMIETRTRHARQRLAYIDGVLDRNEQAYARWQEHRMVKDGDSVYESRF